MINPQMTRSDRRAPQAERDRRSLTQQISLPVLPNTPSKNISEMERWLSIGSGVAIAGAGLLRGRLSGLVALCAGTALVYRGMTGHCHSYDMLGIDTAEHSPNVAVPARARGKVEPSTERLMRYHDELQSMRDRMLSEVDGVVESIREELNPAGNLSGVPVHMGDLAPEQLDADISIVEVERGLIEEVQAALHRIDKGTFGQCTACGTAIAEERLEAIPYAQYCIRCAEKDAQGALS